MNSNWAKVRISEYKGKLRFTIPAKMRREINAKTNNYIRVDLKKGTLSTYYYARVPSMPKSRTNLQVRRAVPKEFTKKASIKKGELINLRISLIENNMPKELIQNNELDILVAIPKKTKTGKNIMIDSFHKDNEKFYRIWYCSGQGEISNQLN